MSDSPPVPAVEAGIVVHAVLVAVCRRDGLSIASDFDTERDAPNYVLAQRLGVGHALLSPDDDLSAMPAQHLCSDAACPCHEGDGRQPKAPGELAGWCPLGWDCPVIPGGSV